MTPRLLMCFLTSVLYGVAAGGVRVQARVHSRYAAHCMAAGNPGVDPELAVGFHLELFTHTARFFGLKVNEKNAHTGSNITA